MLVCAIIVLPSFLVSYAQELTISYLDQSLPLAARQRHLQWAYGFKCGCALCKEQAGAVAS